MTDQLFMQVRQSEAGLQTGISFEHLLDAKKANIASAIEYIRSNIEAGNYDSLKGLILALKGKKLFEDLEKVLRPLAEAGYLDKLEKGYSAHDCKIEQAATKTDYDFSVCNDPVYNRLLAEKEEAEQKLKDRIALLKAFTGPQEMIDEDTGEIVRVMTPNKLQKEGLKITIK